MLTYSTKGQLISECPFGVKTSSKKPTKFLPYFCPSLFLKARAEIGQKFRWFFEEVLTPKGHSEIN